MSADGDSAAVESLLSDLSDNIDGVDIALKPLLTTALSATSSKLPLLDKAKLYVHTAYAIESLVFSYLRLNNVDAKAHPIFKELGRVKAYFGKIQTTESAGPQAKLDKTAANRFIKHALSGNDEYDRKRAEAKKQQEAGAKRKFDELAERYGKGNRFQSTTRAQLEEENEVVGAGAGAGSRDDQAEVEDDEAKEAATEKASKKKDSNKKKRKSQDAAASSSSTPGGEHGSKKRKKGSHAPKDAHQAFESLLAKSGDEKKRAKGAK